MNLKNGFTVMTLLALPSIGVADTLLVPSEYGSIQMGIDAAVSGDIVSVDPGIYSETINFLGKDITVSSASSANDTYINGNALSDSVVMFVSGETNNSILDGFTVRNGATQNGSGIYIFSSSPIIRNCIVKSNHSQGSGGGIFVDTGTVTLEDVIVSDNISNNSGAGLYLKFSSGSMTGGSVEGNVGANGSGIYLKDGTGAFTMTNVTLQGNSASANGGAVFVKNSELIAENCTFDLNTSIDGAGMFCYSGGDAIISNSVFTSNSALGLGGAANIRSNSTVSFLQCTFDSNVADSDCDAVGGGAILNILNSIVTLEDPTICDNLFCDVEDMFIGDDPIIIGDILDCAVADGPGACCGGSACWVMDEVDCLDGGGLWNGSESACADVICEGGGGETTGACCVQSNCVHATEASCVSAGGVFYGTSATCGTTNCPSSCAEDVNGDGMVDVNDLLLLIGAWGMCP